MKYRKKPVVIEARQFKGTEFSSKSLLSWISRNKGIAKFSLGLSPMFFISTLEGEMQVKVNDWVIKGVNGEFYPCKPDIFEKTYEPVD